MIKLTYFLCSCLPKNIKMKRTNSQIYNLISYVRCTLWISYIL